MHTHRIHNTYTHSEQMLLSIEAQLCTRIEYAHTHARTCAHTHAHSNMCMHPQTRTHVHTYSHTTNTHVHTLTHRHPHTHTHTHMHTLTHTHTHSGNGDGFFSSQFQSTLVGNELYDQRVPECQLLLECLETGPLTNLIPRHPPASGQGFIQWWGPLPPQIICILNHLRTNFPPKPSHFRESKNYEHTCRPPSFGVLMLPVAVPKSSGSSPSPPHTHTHLFS